MDVLAVEYMNGFTARLIQDMDAPDPRVEFDNYSAQDVQDWLEGEVFGVEILGPNGEFVDSCGGFYGREWAEQNMGEMLESAAYPDGLEE